MHIKKAFNIPDGEINISLNKEAFGGFVSKEKEDLLLRSVEFL